MDFELAGVGVYTAGEPQEQERVGDMIRDSQSEAYHLLRCLILLALADSVLAEAEAEVLEHSVRVVGQLDAELWERTWAELQGEVDPMLVFEAVPPTDKLRRFILREMASIAMADGEFHPQEEALINQAAATFGLSDELHRYVEWAQKAQLIFDEGEALLKG